MTNRRLVSLAAFAAALMMAASARARGGKTRISLSNAPPPGATPLTPLVRLGVSLPAGFTVTFKTVELSPGADTVLHVQDGNDPEGRFIAGNDDCGTGGLDS